ncbi:MAG: T9SS type A sorting domain-containing protein [Candidatus Eisenbacteria sp.]|nr:T9SS type A sorting domain-containing protein [Candidatus Eisenbacteria bacterium]
MQCCRCFRFRTSTVAAALALAIGWFACGSALAEGSRADQDYAFFLTTDYWSAAEYGTIEIEPPRDVWISPQTPSTDAVAHYDYGEDMVFIVNRYLADNIQLVDPNQSFATTGQYSVGNGSNPHDIRVASSEKAYVSRFEWKTLLIVNPYTGAILDSIDLSPVADGDGIPEMDRMAIVDGKLFVTLNSINHTTWLPDGPGKVAVIDVAADTLVDTDPGAAGVQAITLELENPYTEIRFDPTRQQLIVGCLGLWSALDGGVVAIDPFALESKGVVISETSLGGDVSDALLTPDGKGYAVVMDPSPWPNNFARLVEFDPSTGTVIDTLCQQMSGMGSSMAGMELNSQGELYLCDRDATNPRVRIYDTGTNGLLEAIDVGLPPFDIAFVQPPWYLHVVLDPEHYARPAVALGQNYPNPFNPETAIPFDLVEGGGVRLDIYDVQGKRVVTLVDGWFPAGLHHVLWAGRNEAGVEARAGVFFCRLRAGGQTVTRKMILAR